MPEKYLRLTNERRADMMPQAGEWVIVLDGERVWTWGNPQDQTGNARQRVVTGEGELVVWGIG